MDYNHYLGFQFDSIRNFCSKNNISDLVKTSKQQLYKILYKKKTKTEILNYDYVKNIIEPWKKDFCFIPLDKYLKLIQKEFNSKYYIILTESTENITKCIKKVYKATFIGNPKYNIKKD